MKPIIGITCNYDYRDSVGMAFSVGVCGQVWHGKRIGTVCKDSERERKSMDIKEQMF